MTMMMMGQASELHVSPGTCIGVRGDTSHYIPSATLSELATVESALIVRFLAYYDVGAEGVDGSSVGSAEWAEVATSH